MVKNEQKSHFKNGGSVVQEGHFKTISGMVKGAQKSNFKGSEGYTEVTYPNCITGPLLCNWCMP